VPDADAIALEPCTPLSCVAACVFEEALGASAVAVAALLTCAAVVAMAHRKIEAAYKNFIRLSNFRYSKRPPAELHRSQQPSLGWVIAMPMGA
jgi:hypothetical protein